MVGIEVRGSIFRDGLKRRFIAATIVATVGVFVLFLVSRLLLGMLDDAGIYLGCVCGAFLVTLMVYSPSHPLSLKRFGASVAIVLGTYALIACGYLLDKIARGVFDPTRPTEAKNTFIWALMTTSWWLVPGVMLTLWALDRRADAGTAGPRR